MYPILFKLGPIQIAGYGVMMTLGFFTGLVLLRRELARKGLDVALAEWVIIAAMAGGLAGAKLYYLIETYPAVTQDPAGMIISGSGFTWYGGLIVGAVAVITAIRRSGQPLLPAIDAVAPELAIGYAFGRMGCQLAGDGDYGMPTDLPWGMAYPNGTVPTIERVHPAPVYEILQSLLIFWVLWSLRVRLKQPGQLFGVYLILTGIARFAVEFIRLNPPMLFGLSDAQVISLLMVVGGSVWVVAMHRGSGTSPTKTE
ncbi:MAG: prolipoprotein diacylglyceryl transferase [Candidatus Latescibacteria bacterium]|nr:prolipoprotein diacylglyceryl transferase [Candidatus Latescibacterota bacterium]